MQLLRIPLCPALLMLVSLMLPAAADDQVDTPPRPAPALTDPEFTRFVGRYCVKCHGPDLQKGERRFDQLQLADIGGNTLVDFQDMLDQLILGEMPPEKAQQPPQEQRQQAIHWLTAALERAHALQTRTGGETVLRRLNRREYLNTVQDLFGLDMTMFDPANRFPRDQTVEHLDNIGDTLVTSGFLLEQYLDAADKVVEKALGVTDRPAEQTWTFNGNFRQQPELDPPHGEVYGFKYLCLYEPTTTVRHEGSYGPIRDFSRGVPADGRYEIRVLAEAKNRINPYRPELLGRDVDAPFRLGVVPGNLDFGPLHHPQPIEPVLDEVTLQDGEPQWYTLNVWLDKGFTPRFTFPNGMADGRRAFTDLIRKHTELFPEEVHKDRGIFRARFAVMRYGSMPHIRLHEIHIRGPLIPDWPPAGYVNLLGGTEFEPSRTRELLERFARRAYRRPPLTDEVDRLMAVYEHRLADGLTPFAAFKDSLKTALCSPAFLYLDEPLGDRNASGSDRLSPHALAARLSYFLWSTMPDAELDKLADDGSLLSPQVLADQVRRMLADPRADQFVVGFTDSWLNLRSLGDMPPDREAFERYYSENLESAMLTETRMFIRHLIDENLSIRQLLDADYSFINKPLARLYGMADQVDSADGHMFRKVKFTDPHRGGLLGQASVLTVTANGVETSPVIRGVWLLENILGTPPSPPPADVPAIDPDVRGARSMREILTKHRDSPACFECHQKIDPLGFALESFDPIGAWRNNYETGGAIDTAGELPGGLTFADIGELKKILLQRDELFTRMLATRLLSYACGRRMEPLDRPHIDQVVQAAQERGAGLCDLLEQVVLSQPFATP